MKNPPWRNGERRITSPPLFILSLFTDSSLYNLPTVKLCLEINRSQETDGTYCMYTIYCLVKHIFMSHAHSLQSPVDFLCLHQTANSATMKLMLLSYLTLFSTDCSEFSLALSYPVFQNTSCHGIAVSLPLCFVSAAVQRQLSHSDGQ